MEHPDQWRPSRSAAQTQRLLEERARLLARIPEAPRDSRETLELVTFHLGAEYMGLPSALVYETQPLRVLQWAPVPCAPSFIVGILNLRGHLCSIMDLTRFWGLPARPPADKAHVLRVCGGVCKDGKAMELALLTDDLPQVCEIPLASLGSAPATLPAQVQNYVRGVSPDLLIVLDLERLLSDPQLIVYDEI
ncbi:MAG TPA: chemotaxis protein CheW [Candidatus Competibacteraceae bacterium]|nr:chemotaxis protein CheW [Candidatus Competibacter sp.]MDG4605139.1 chemotaxis protein CheW [Candidatus Contendobacter sp.]HRD48823.1 chemotaxis protein CheW [Candidatus Contendobacter sp.]HRF43978.1 chemotaxis protein CheW [Candidatus Competibacteraceae bacterium]